jgi:hypothetical protein
LFGLATAQKILRAGYFWPTIFKDCINTVQKCHPCQIFSKKMHAHPTPLHPVVAVGPFAKWGINFTTCKPPSVVGHNYIIVVVDYFTKWEEAMPTFSNDAKTVALFVFNHIIACFGVPKSIVTDHGSHFCNSMMTKLSTLLHFDQEHSSPYYPQENGQVESINKVLKTMLQRMIGKHKTNWNLMLFLALWAYQTSTKTATDFTPFQLVYGLEAVLPIECEIPSLKLVVELFLTLPSKKNDSYIYPTLMSDVDEAIMANESHQKCVKHQYDKKIRPRTFSEGDLVLVYDQDRDKLGVGKFEPLWHGPYIIK